MRAAPILAAIVALALLVSACGGDEDTLESLAGTPASVHIVKDVETMAKACAKENKKTHEAAVKAYASDVRERRFPGTENVYPMKKAQ